MIARRGVEQSPRGSHWAIRQHRRILDSLSMTGRQRVQIGCSDWHRQAAARTILSSTRTLRIPHGTHATHAVGAIGGGRATNFASLRRFCAIAASVNSNCAPAGPRRRNRPSRLFLSERVQIRVKLCEVEALQRLATCGQRLLGNVGYDLIAVLLVKAWRHELDFAPCDDDEVALCVPTKSRYVMSALNLRVLGDIPRSTSLN